MPLRSEECGYSGLRTRPEHKNECDGGDIIISLFVHYGSNKFKSCLHFPAIIMMPINCLSLSVYPVLLGAVVNGLIPATPREQTARAVASIQDAIEHHRQEGKPLRFFVDYLIPLPPETKAEDIDPWPGGLAQMYPYAEDILTSLLGGVVDEPAGPCSSQIISAPDCCGFFIQESKTSAKNDIAAILFPGVDQLTNIEQIDAMVGDRPLFLFNKQFQRPADFGFLKKEQSQKQIFDRFSQGFAFQEFACRGEDTKLIYEFPHWTAVVVYEGDELGNNREMLLSENQQNRPTYEALEQQINKLLPEPLWMRKMEEAERKGFKFQR
jgi:hypothetical protein